MAGFYGHVYNRGTVILMVVSSKINAYRDVMPYGLVDG